MSSTATSGPDLRVPHSRCCSSANQPKTPNSGKIASVPNSISCSANRPRRQNAKPSRKNVPNSRTRPAAPCYLKRTESPLCRFFFLFPKAFPKATTQRPPRSFASTDTACTETIPSSADPTLRALPRIPKTQLRLQPSICASRIRRRRY